MLNTELLPVKPCNEVKEKIGNGKPLMLDIILKKYGFE
jgi:hypothetical protein